MQVDDISMTTDVHSLELCKGNITGDTAGWSAFEFQLQLASVRISTPTE